MKTSMSLQIVILAAGEGKRMYSTLPKVLHPLAGVPLLERVITTANLLDPAAIHVVYGHGGAVIKETLRHVDVHWVEQPQQLGTGHALLQVLPYLKDTDQILVLMGDVPLITVATLKKLLEYTQHVGFITAEVTDPSGYGRVLRNAQQEVLAIVEEKDADPEQRLIKEIYTGILTASARQLQAWLPELRNDNVQGEYYLTDIVSHAVAANEPIVAVLANSVEEVQGVNDRAQLAYLERCYQRNLAKQLMCGGVTIIDPERFDVRGSLQVGQDVTFDVNVICEGDVVIGSRCVIGPNCLLRNVRLGDHVVIKANSVVEDAQIDERCIIGPFARIRPGTQLASDVHVGNFVEVKNSEIGKYSKISHLSYVGDATVGCEVNIGAGTITCNYDGVHKHRTVIGDRVQIGSDTQLVAPVTIGAGATIGAGSTITQDAPPEMLTLSRVKQQTVPGWRRGKK